MQSIVFFIINIHQYSGCFRYEEPVFLYGNDQSPVDIAHWEPVESNPALLLVTPQGPLYAREIRRIVVVQQ